MCVNKLKGVDKNVQATQIIIDHIGLPEDQYRLGRTKVFNS